MSFTANRSDVSEWLIHFVRDRVADDDLFDDEGEEIEGIHIEGVDGGCPAQDILRNIVSLGGLIPGHSFRRGGPKSEPKTTIYGGSPAVCFTEAPLSGFAQYVQDRSSDERCAPYGICLLKREVFAAGGRPVIYGLAGSVQPPLTRNTTNMRIIDTAVLPLAEQFRYVAYDPGRERPLDWTHEREWRWIATDDDRHSIWYVSADKADMRPGLPLFAARERGGFFSRVGVLTKTRQEADDLAKILLRCRDAGSNDYSTPYSNEVLSQSFVIPLEDALQSGATRIEDLAPEFLLVAKRPEPSAQLVERTKAAIERARSISAAAAAAFLQTAHKAKDGSIADVCGCAAVITTESTSPIVAALLACSLAEPRIGEYYTVHAMAVPGHDQALSYYEAAAVAACDYLRAELGDIFQVRTWWD